MNKNKIEIKYCNQSKSLIVKNIIIIMKQELVSSFLRAAEVS